MAKRFTDTSKWKDTWFQDLPNKYKLFWIYLLDECDAAGLWKPNIRLAQFQVGEPFEESELKRVFAGRIIITEDNYWFIPKFITFQYGELSTNSKPHQSIIKMLERSKLIGYVKGIDTLKEKEKEEEEESNVDKALKNDTYLNGGDAWADITSDALFLERLVRIVRGTGATEENVLKATKYFLTLEDAKPNFDMRPRDELKKHLVNWLNTQKKNVTTY